MNAFSSAPANELKKATGVILHSVMHLQILDTSPSCWLIAERFGNVGPARPSKIAKATSGKGSQGNGHPVGQYWLMKSEPDPRYENGYPVHMSFADLKAWCLSVLYLPGRCRGRLSTQGRFVRTS